MGKAILKVFQKVSLVESFIVTLQLCVPFLKVVDMLVSSCGFSGIGRPANCEALFAIQKTKYGILGSTYKRRPVKNYTVAASRLVEKLILRTLGVLRYGLNERKQ